MKTETKITLGVVASVAVAAWYFWDKLANFNKGTAYEGTGAVGTLGNVANQLSGGALQTAGETLSRWTYDLFNSDEIGETTFYTVTFPDGQRHAVGASTVSKSGTFTYNGKAYTLYVDASGKKFAK